MTARDAISLALQKVQADYQAAVSAGNGGPLLEAAHRFNVAACWLARSLQQIAAGRVGRHSYDNLALAQARCDEARRAYAELRGLTAGVGR